MGYYKPMLALLVLVFLWKAEARASAVATSEVVQKAMVARSPSSSDTTLPSAATLAGCPTSCGNLSFEYPFGVGPDRCFRGPDFRLLCNSTAGAQPRKLFLYDTNIEVLQSIEVSSFDLSESGDTFNFNFLEASFSQSIPIRSGVDVYNMSLKAPGNSFSIIKGIVVHIIGCDLDVLLKEQDTGSFSLLCTVTCPNKTIAEMVYMQDCDAARMMPA